MEARRCRDTRCAETQYETPNLISSREIIVPATVKSYPICSAIPYVPSKGPVQDVIVKCGDTEIFRWGNDPRCNPSDQMANTQKKVPS